MVSPFFLGKHFYRSDQPKTADGRPPRGGAHRNWTSSTSMGDRPPASAAGRADLPIPAPTRRSRPTGRSGSWVDSASPKCAFVLSRARDGFSGSAPSWVRLRSHLRGRFQATKGPDVAWGDLRPEPGLGGIRMLFLEPAGYEWSYPGSGHNFKKNAQWGKHSS